MKNRKRMDRIEASLLNVQRAQAEVGPDAIWQRNLMDRVRGSARRTERREAELPVWRFAWAAAAVAAMVLGVSVLTADSGWIPDNCLFNVQQAVVDL